jgi:hypothetical protein
MLTLVKGIVPQAHFSCAAVTSASGIGVEIQRPAFLDAKHAGCVCYGTAATINPHIRNTVHTDSTSNAELRTPPGQPGAWNS